MVQIAGKYECYKNENLVEFLLTWGLPEDRAKAVASDKNTIEFKVDGNKIVTSSTTSTTVSSTLKLNETVDEVIGSGTYKTTTVLNGDVLTATAEKDGKSFTRNFKFSDKEVVLTMNGTSSGDVIATRYFKRV